MQNTNANAAAAEAVVDWFDARSDDDVGAILDALWSLGRSAPAWCPDLAEHAKNVMALTGPERKVRDPRALGAFAELLEHAALRIRTAAAVAARTGGGRGRG